MATYFTNFSEFAVGTFSDADWSERFYWGACIPKIESDGDLGGQCLYMSQDGGLPYFLSYDGLGSQATLDLLTKVRCFQYNDTKSIRLYARGSGSVATMQAYYVQLDKYYGRIKLFKKLANVYPETQIGLGNFYFNINTWVWVRFNLSGSALKAKAWVDGSSEQPDWAIEVTDSDIGAGGWFGPGFYHRASDFDYFSVGTGGDTAPDPVPACLTAVSLLAPNLYTYSLRTESIIATDIEPMVWPMNF